MNIAILPFSRFPQFLKLTRGRSVLLLAAGPHVVNDTPETALPTARPEALKPANPGPLKPGQAKPDIRLWAQASEISSQAGPSSPGLHIMRQEVQLELGKRPQSASKPNLNGQKYNNVKEGSRLKVQITPSPGSSRGQALFEGLGLGVENPEPEPALARPKPGLSGQTGRPGRQRRQPSKNSAAST
ncbi:hypothetical protein B0H12DRAFT_1072375 [Mycena haematopus]|nr:hypothetical protein B0H12DRAFT_1072375 [Mycena haematopus]